MTLRVWIGYGLCGASCVAMWRTLEAVSEGDPLAGFVGLLVTWVVARAGVDLATQVQDETSSSGDRPDV